MWLIRRHGMHGRRRAPRGAGKGCQCSSRSARSIYRFISLTRRRFRKPSQRQVDRFYQWRERLTLIGSDIGNLLLGRYIFRESQRVISKNPKLKGIFARWLAINYANKEVLQLSKR